MNFQQKQAQEFSDDLNYEVPFLWYPLGTNERATGGLSNVTQRIFEGNDGKS